MIVKENSKNYKDLVNKAAEIIKNGGIVILPFDTVYGIVCSPRNDCALKKIFEFKNRPINQTIGLAVANINSLKNYCRINKEQLEYIQQRTPGKYTFILTAKDNSI